jgi:hypothetical protein
MGIWLFYLLALIPVGVGGILWIRSKEVTWGEWLGGAAIGFLTAAIFQVLSVAGMTHDIETWSGQINKAVHNPEWVEEYQQMHTRTVGSGEDAYEEVYYTTEYRTHPEYWEVFTTIPDSHEVDKKFYTKIVEHFGGAINKTKASKSGFYSGDPNIYVTTNTTGYCYPVTATKSWENRVKAAPTLFSFVNVPDSIGVYEWPKNPDWRKSDRLLGTASKHFNIGDLDRLNARIGASKMVNVIIVGAGNRDQDFAEWQRAKWVGGKKNDLVLCYGKVINGKPGWAKVFGWSDSEICKRNLETILLSNPLGPEVLTKVESEIVSNYKIKDWSAFDYITVEPPMWSYFVFFVVLVMSQVGFYVWAHNNELYKTKGKLK